MTEDAKASAMRKAKFAALTKTFYDPEGTILHQRQLDRDKLKSQSEQRAGTPNKEQEKDQTAPVAEAPKYYALAPEQWKKCLLDMRQQCIVKHARVHQTLFYLLGYTREEICERDTNALDFKKAKDLINESLFQKMGNYNPLGRREGDFKDYQKISFLKANIKDLDEEKVEDFSLCMGKVLQWIKLALDIRIEDIVNRRDTVEYIKQDREQAIRADAERTKKYEAEVAEKKQAFDEAQAAEAEKAKEAGEEPAVDDNGEPKPVPQFDELEFKVEFELQNPEITVAPEPPEEVDNDYDLAYKPPVADTE